MPCRGLAADDPQLLNRFRQGILFSGKASHEAAAANLAARLRATRRRCRVGLDRCFQPPLAARWGLVVVPAVTRNVYLTFIFNLAATCSITLTTS